MENTASHETVYKLAHRADKANLSSDCYVGSLVGLMLDSENLKGARTKFTRLVSLSMVLLCMRASTPVA